MMDLVDIVTKGTHSLLILLIVPLTILLVGPAIRPAQAVHHFTFHRMQHYEFGGSVRGKKIINSQKNFSLALAV